jgi:hypothetical protein
MRKEDFPADDWNILREAPHWAALAVMVAGSSGLFGSVKEAFAIGHSLHRGIHHPEELIRSLASRQEADAAARSIRSWIGKLHSGDPKAHVLDTALEKLQTAGRIIASHSPEAANIYRDWVLSVATDVANSAREGAVLGFGGARISSAEQSVLAQIEAALQRTE